MKTRKTNLQKMHDNAVIIHLILFAVSLLSMVLLPDLTNLTQGTRNVICSIVAVMFLSLIVNAFLVGEFIQKRKKINPEKI